MIPGGVWRRGARRSFIWAGKFPGTERQGLTALHCSIPFQRWRRQAARALDIHGLSLNSCERTSPAPVRSRRRQNALPAVPPGILRRPPALEDTMSQTTATHALAPLVARLVDAAELEPEALELRDPSLGPKEYIEAMAKAGQHIDAIKFLAHLPPGREAVWWAWMCARREAGPNPEPEIAVALEATETWIGEPTDQNRRAAMQAAEAASFETAAGCAALAA